MLGDIKFNHGLPASRSKDANRRPVLVQNGIIFTNAELNRFSGKYEPEPVPISPDEPYREMLMPKVLSLVEEIQKLNDTVSELIEPMKMVLANENILIKPSAVGPTTGDFIKPIMDENEFKFFGKEKFQKYVENNKERIAQLDEGDSILDAIILKWESFFPNEALIL